MSRLLDPTAAAFLASLDGDSALEALREARIAAKAFGWSEDTQRAVTAGLMTHFGERRASLLAAKRHDDAVLSRLIARSV